MMETEKEEKEGDEKKLIQINTLYIQERLVMPAGTIKMCAPLCSFNEYHHLLMSQKS